MTNRPRKPSLFQARNSHSHVHSPRKPGHVRGLDHLHREHQCANEAVADLSTGNCNYVPPNQPAVQHRRSADVVAPDPTALVTKVIETVSVLQIVDLSGSIIEILTRFGPPSTVVTGDTLADTVAADTAPPDTISLNTVLAGTVLVGTNPANIISANTVPADTIPTNTIPANTIPTNTDDILRSSIIATLAAPGSSPGLLSSSELLLPTTPSITVPTQAVSVPIPSLASISPLMPLMNIPGIATIDNLSINSAPIRHVESKVDLPLLSQPLTTLSSTLLASSSTLPTSSSTLSTSSSALPTSSSALPTSSPTPSALSSTSSTLANTLSTLSSTLSTTSQSSTSPSTSLSTAASSTISSSEPSATDVNGGIIGGGGGSAGNSNSTSVASAGSGASNLSPQQKQVIGGVVGGVAGAAFFVLLVMLALRYKRRWGSGALQGTVQSGRASNELLPTVNAPGEAATAGEEEGAPGSAGGGAMTERYGSAAITTAFTSLIGKRPTNSAHSTNTSERGFYRVAGRKLPSVLQVGGNGYTDPRVSVVSSQSGYGRDSESSEHSEGGATRLALGAPMRPISGVPIIRSGPARVAVAERNPFADPPSTPSSDVLAPSLRLTDGPERGSRFQESV